MKTITITFDKLVPILRKAGYQIGECAQLELHGLIDSQCSAACQINWWGPKDQHKGALVIKSVPTKADWRRACLGSGDAQIGGYSLDSKKRRSQIEEDER